MKRKYEHIEFTHKQDESHDSQNDNKVLSRSRNQYPAQPCASARPLFTRQSQSKFYSSVQSDSQHDNMRKAVYYVRLAKEAERCRCDEDAARYWDQAAMHYEAENSKENMAFASMKVAQASRGYDKKLAYAYFNKAANIYLDLNKEQKTADIYQEMAKLAVDFFDESLAYDSSIKAAEIYWALKKDEKAIGSYKFAFKIAESKQDTKNQIFCLQKLIGIKEKLSHFKSSLARSNKKLAKCYVIRCNLSEALECFKKAKKIYEELNQPNKLRYVSQKIRSVEQQLRHEEKRNAIKCKTGSSMFLSSNRHRTASNNENLIIDLDVIPTRICK